MFVFDNFETLRNPMDLFRWLDNTIRLPNKVLITTRHRDFNGDYFVEVPGMDSAESADLIAQTCKDLKISRQLTPQYRDDIIRESYGHPYVIKILLGEVAKTGKFLKVERLVANKDDILEALFERTYNLLHPTARRMFLTVCSWRSAIPVLGLEAVLLRPGNEKLDVSSGVEELRRSSLINMTASPADREEFLTVPLAASVFGRAKLRVSPLKTAIEADREMLQMFGATQLSGTDQGVAPQVVNLLRRVARLASVSARIVSEYLPVIEFVSRRHPRAWLLLSDIYEEAGDPTSLELAKGVVRRYLQACDDEEGWQKLVTLCRRTEDWNGEMHALLGLVEISQISFGVISASASRMNQLFRESRLELDSLEKRKMAERMLEVMEKRIDEGDATDCSRLAWLALHLQQEKRARSFAEKGLKREARNTYCQSLIAKLDLSAKGAASGG